MRDEPLALPMVGLRARILDLPHPYDEFRVFTLALPMVGRVALHLAPMVGRAGRFPPPSPLWSVERVGSLPPRPYGQSSDESLHQISHLIGYNESRHQESL